MADIEVIYDPVKEFAAIVNLDERASWGPAFIGPNAGTILQAWVDATPFDVTILDHHTAVIVFQEWLRSVTADTPQQAATSPESPVESLDDGRMGDPQLAEHEAAAAASEPPSPQPADTDMDADASPEAALVICPLCAGHGVTSDGPDGSTQTCAMCQGTKVVRMAVPS